MTQAKQQKAAGAAYRDYIRDTKEPKQVELVDVKAPSGFIFKFEKPSKFKTLFGSGTLPLSATNGAVEKWLEDGVGSAPVAGEENKAQFIQFALTMRDKVLRLSHTPKLVVGMAKNDNELSTDDVDDDDLDYLFKWVAAGGEVSGMLGTFPEQSQSSSLASAARQKRRVEVQHVSGDQG